jgi:hypothetical protein
MVHSYLNVEFAFSYGQQSGSEIDDAIDVGIDGDTWRSDCDDDNDNDGSGVDDGGVMIVKVAVDDTPSLFDTNNDMLYDVDGLGKYDEYNGICKYGSRSSALVSASAEDGDDNECADNSWVRTVSDESDDDGDIWTRDHTIFRVNVDDSPVDELASIHVGNWDDSEVDGTDEAVHIDDGALTRRLMTDNSLVGNGAWDDENGVIDDDEARIDSESMMTSLDDLASMEDDPMAPEDDETTCEDDPTTDDDDDAITELELATRIDDEASTSSEDAMIDEDAMAKLDECTTPDDDSITAEDEARMADDDAASDDDAIG